MKLLLASTYLFCFFTFCAAQPFIGEIRLFAGNFAPRNWAFCDGSVLPIDQNEALFAVLGAQYGGDGRTTFALPDLRGRVPVGAGSGPGLSNIVEGQTKGAETVSLAANNLPPHTHTASFDLETEGSSDVNVELSGITAETTIDLSGVMTSEATISIPEQTCPVSGGGSSTASVSVSTSVKTTKPPRRLFFSCRGRNRCVPAFRMVLARKKNTQDTILAGSGTVDVGDGTGGDAQCPKQDDVTVPASPLTGTATATTSVTGASGTLSIPSVPVTGTITVGSAASAPTPFGILQPSLGMNYIIAIIGVFPSRN